MKQRKPKIRKTWGALKPVTKRIESKKKYKRKLYLPPWMLE